MPGNLTLSICWTSTFLMTMTNHDPWEPQARPKTPSFTGDRMTPELQFDIERYKLHKRKYDDNHRKAIEVLEFMSSTVARGINSLIIDCYAPTEAYRVLRKVVSPSH
ncbi:hypothetical protein EJ06DRAFT_556165 [Trichodelitschia bisporula]|uniref:Uncharacterized protein n=1 Tax=Trichodelitschia bisporula TaxID=703511 RepID=A0A6G1HX38_9PEZI|nr:hypothetical protein EJ06DRAFT_556165 [Trichodelitschia bisporula]